VRKLQNNLTQAETEAKTLMTTFGGDLSTIAQKRSINLQKTRNKTIPSQNRKIYSFQARTRLSVIKISGKSMRNCWQPHFRTAGLNVHTHSSVMIRNLVFFKFSLSIVKFWSHISRPKTYSDRLTDTDNDLLN
jgi:hypothetical protein